MWAQSLGQKMPRRGMVFISLLPGNLRWKSLSGYLLSMSQRIRHHGGLNTHVTSILILVLVFSLHSVLVGKQVERASNEAG